MLCAVDRLYSSMDPSHKSDFLFVCLFSEVWSHLGISGHCLTMEKFTQTKYVHIEIGFDTH